MATLSLQKIKKTYPNGYAAIHGVDLEIADGEFIVIVGPSGCGKSTLLRMIAGLEQISDGTMKIDDTVVNKLEPAQRDIAMVFQNYALYPHMSVFDNMAYGLRNRGVAKDEILRKVEDTAKILELEQLLDRKPKQLSGGQRQRVAMGRAIVRDPKAFLFDEPLSNLDAKLRAQMRIEIKRLQKRLGTTAVYVTHDQVEAMTLADRLVVMNGGVAEQIGSPMEIYERPATTFVAGFIGSPSINFLGGQITDGKLLLDGADHPIDVATSHEGPVTVGLRPEHLTQEGAAEHHLDTRIELLEPLGSDTLIYTTLPHTREELVVRLNGNIKLEHGSSLRLGFNSADLHLFCPETQQRLI